MTENPVQEVESRRVLPLDDEAAEHDEAEDPFAGLTGFDAVGADPSHSRPRPSEDR